MNSNSHRFWDRRRWFSSLWWW